MAGEFSVINLSLRFLTCWNLMDFWFSTARVWPCATPGLTVINQNSVQWKEGLELKTTEPPRAPCCWAFFLQDSLPIQRSEVSSLSRWDDRAESALSTGAEPYLSGSLCGRHRDSGLLRVSLRRSGDRRTTLRSPGRRRIFQTHCGDLEHLLLHTDESWKKM